MSCVSIYRPSLAVLDEPATIPFPRLFGNLKTRNAASDSALNRARLVHENRQCPCCNSVAIDPMELNDFHLNGAGKPIPGTATIVAFHCNHCLHEWPVQS